MEWEFNQEKKLKEIEANLQMEREQCQKIGKELLELNANSLKVSNKVWWKYDYWFIAHTSLECKSDLWSNEHYLTSDKNNVWKKFRPVTELNSWPLWYQCSALVYWANKPMGSRSLCLFVINQWNDEWMTVYHFNEMQIKKWM